MKFNRPQGFTLLEVLIVLVIVAVMAGLAIPTYTSTVEKSRKQEALTTLSALRASEQRYYAINGSYTGTIGQLDFDPTFAAGVTQHFTYGVSGGGAAFTATATRNSSNFTASANCSSSYTITLNQAGTMAGAGC